MTFISNRRVVATIVAASCMAVPASAAADSPPPTFRSDAAQSGGDRSQSEVIAKSTRPHGGDGDAPYDHPGMSRASQYDAPTTIEVVRPERTIVRDVDEALPLIMSSTALLLVLAGFGIPLVRTRIVARTGRTP
jgi:hypothetical protein